MSTDRIGLSRKRVLPYIARELAGEGDVERIFAASATFQEVEHPSRILRTRSEGRHRCGELYRNMPERDGHLRGLELKRADAVLNLPRRLEPGDPSPKAQEARDLCRWTLAHISDLDINLRHQLGSVGRGIAFEELIWERLTRGPWAGALVPVALIDRPMWRFAFDRKTHTLHVRQPDGDPIPAPPGKFQIARYGSKDNPWGGEALLDSVYWPHFLKHHGWQFWAVFTEKWAQPSSYAKYPFSRSDEKANQKLQEEALAVAEAIQAEFAMAIPDDVSLGLLEATRSGSISYETFIDSCNRVMSLVYHGEINTNGLRPGVGAFASEKVSNEIRKEKVVLDAKALAACWTGGLLRWISDVNYGSEVAPPRLEIDTVEAEDRALRQQGIQNVFEAGKPVPHDYFYLTNQVRPPEDGEPVVTAPVAAQLAAPAEAPAKAPSTLADVELER